MRDEKRREELNAKINEQIEKISIEDLDKVAGGDMVYFVCTKCNATFSRNVSKCPKCGSTKIYNRTDR